MKIIAGDICVRDILEKDAEAYYRLYSHPDVARYDDFEPITREDLKSDMARIASYREGSLNREYGVAMLPEDQIVGVITVDKKRKYCYLGYHFHPEVHGKGVALKSVTLFLSWLPADVKKLLRAVVDPDNKASSAFTLKIGFIRTGRRISNGKREIVFSPQFD